MPLLARDHPPPHARPTKIQAQAPPPGSFAAFAHAHFVTSCAAHYTREEVRHQVLRATPDDDKKLSVNLYRILLRFMGDVADYRQNLPSTYQPNLGPVMARLHPYLHITPAEAAIRREEFEMKNNYTGPLCNNGPSVTPPIKKCTQGGTLRRQKAPLRGKFDTNVSNNTVFGSLPLEESLLTPLEQVHFIVGCGIIKPSIRDEIYCHVMKQLSENPFKSSVSRGWLLMQLLCTCCPPSTQIRAPLQHFLQIGPPLHTLNCRKALQRALQNGGRAQPPAFIEMEACLQKTLLEVAVTPMDGSVHTLAVDGASSAEELMAQLAGRLQLQEVFGFSIYIAMYEKVVSIGNGRDLLLDAISECEQLHKERENLEEGAPWRLYLRKELFSPWESALSDPAATALLYSQVVRGVMLGEYTYDQDSDLAILVAQRYFIERGNDMDEEALTALLPSYIPPDQLVENDALCRWKRQVVLAHEQLLAATPGRETDRVRRDVVDRAKTQWRMTFSRYYDVRAIEGPEWPSVDLCVVVNWAGLSVLTDTDTLLELGYPELTAVTDGGSPTGHVVTFFMASGVTFKVTSSDGADLRHVVTYLLAGLRQRSIYTVATEDYTAKNSSEISFREGDLVLLTSPASLDAKRVDAVNQRTGDVGQVDLERVYRLPTLTSPSDDLLRCFKTVHAE